MNDYCADIGFRSLNKNGELLCGDNVAVTDDEDGNTIIVLADGLGSGVKACILSTLTSKIISTMMAAKMGIDECVETIAATLPICSVRGVAYSTFTIMRILENKYAEIIQYDNPHVILLRGGKHYEFPKTSKQIGGKEIFFSRIRLDENDIFLLISDGCIHAGISKTLNHGWERENIIAYTEPFFDVGFTAKTLTTILLDECDKLYGGQPGDDTTVCAVKIRKRIPMNLLLGPPENRDDCDKMMSLFFSKDGKHIVCGGTTSSIAAEFLKQPLIPTLDYLDNDIPPIAKIKGVDLVTEGVVTISRVLQYAENYLECNEYYKDWGYKKDAASQISRFLFEEATDINFYVGRAKNPAHQNPNLPINFNIKMHLVDELSKALEAMGKRIKVSYF